MRSNYTFLFAIIVAISFTTSTLQAQYSPAIVAGFGIDGDVLSGQAQNGNLLSNATWDWFKKAGNGPNVGLGIVDTSGNLVNKVKIAAGDNFTFTKGQAFGRYTVQGGYLMLDTRYARDNFGYSNAPGQKDFTTYTNGSKNGDNPTIWVTTPNGASVANKADIIDAYIHMRRDGTTINNTNPSPLIIVMGINTVGNTGSRYIDFELYRERINYDQNTGNFSNSGPSAFGGHSVWEFNPNGSIKNIGDMTVSFSYGTNGIEEIGVYIWVSKTDHANINPSRFDFVNNEFYGSGNGANYGYAKIVPDAGGVNFKAWGSVTSSSTSAAPWGTNSKSLGNSPSNYFSNNYDALDFGEVAIDLTSLGIDPALSVGMDPCTPPFTRVMAKTRSSSSFTSALQDFMEPYEFLDAPQAPANITPPQTLQCNRTSVTLSPASIQPGATYRWSTSNGNIVSDPNASSITVNKEGKYYLNSSIVAGCPENRDSTIVTSDYYKPVASAGKSGGLNNTGLLDDLNPLVKVNLLGGDVNLSNFNTPFGGSNGLDWKWTGPNGFTANTRNVNNINTKGTYNLELTESRNGCIDYASTNVLSVQEQEATPLSVKVYEFSAVKKNKVETLLKWKIGDSDPDRLELMRSYNGIDFKTAALFFFDGDMSELTYNDKVAEHSGKQVYYKMKITSLSGAEGYSKVIAVSFQNDMTVTGLQLSPNPAKTNTVLGVRATKSADIRVQLLDANGRVVQQINLHTESGLNQVMFSDLNLLKPGLYFFRIEIEGEIRTQKLIITK
jgi:hypothetical protein